MHERLPLPRPILWADLAPEVQARCERITGTLLDPSGQPVADALLECVADPFDGGEVAPFASGVQATRFSATTSTDEQGRFTFYRQVPTAEPARPRRLCHIYFQPMPTLEWLYRGTGDTVDPLTAAPVAFGSHGIALVVTQQSVAAQRPQWKAPTFEGPAGEAALTVRFPSGQPYDRDHRVWVERVDDGEVVVAPDFELWDTIPWTHVTLPPGRYRATASSEEHAPMCGTGWRPRLPPYGDAVVEFDVAAGQRTHADLIFAEGGWLRLALPVQGLPKDPLSSKALRCCSSNDFAAAARGAGSGTVVAVHADGTRTPLWFCAPRLLSVYSFPGIIPGTECLSRTVLPPGKYTLIVDVPGYQAAEVHTQVTAGEIRRVEVRLR